MLFQTKNILLVAFVLFISGCSNKGFFSKSSSSEDTYSYKDYESGEYRTTPKDGKINNSAAMHRATMRAYQINGKWYYPTLTSIGQSYDGIASWYGPNFHGKYTSNGEVYDMHAHTAAHKTLPMNTMLKVVNKSNSRATVVRVNDRGPFVDDRIIDLSNQAARDIDMLKKGTAPVTIEVIGFEGKISTLVAQKEDTTSDNFKTTIETSNFYVQIGAFKNLSGAKQLQAKHSLVNGRYKSIIKEVEVNGETLHKVLLSGFRSEDEAKDFRNSSSDFKGAIIIGE